MTTAKRVLRATGWWLFNHVRLGRFAPIALSWLLDSKRKRLK